MAGLLDFLQSASNTAADTVAAPVDVLAWALRKAGVPVGTPVGGTDWMRRQGLRRDVPQSAASLAGETVGLLSPMVAAAKAPQIAKGLLQVEANAAAPRTLRPEAGAIVWHGSPHKFDRFDSSKIGTGEGAQAYGHGLYLAESPGVAGSYKAALSGRGDAASAATKHIPARQFTADELAAILRAATGDDPIELAARRLGYRAATLRDVDQAALTRAIADVRDQAQGSLYKVDLPDDKIARMLDWDKPLSQQALNVQQALGPKVVQRNGGWYVDSGAKHGDWKFATEAEAASEARQAAMSRDVTGSVLHDRLKIGADAETAQLLRQLGIPGIRYLDGGSRGTGAGTSNFVVFPGEENALRILERNGLLAP
jgi:hypothetical protein